MAELEQQACQTKPYRSSRKVHNTVECESCGLYGMCKVAGLERAGNDIFDEIVVRREQVASGQQIVTRGTAFDEIFAVKSGAFKTYTTLANGKEQIIDFYFPGELIGLEGIAGQRYPHNVDALESSSICRLSFSSLHLLKERQDDFKQQLIRALSMRTMLSQWVPLMMGAQNAEQRTATFLLSLSTRLAEHELPSIRFKLPMSRHDIANYLGLAVETVSRMFQRFQSMSLLEVHGRHVELRDVPGLHAVAGLATE